MLNESLLYFYELAKHGSKVYKLTHGANHALSLPAAESLTFDGGSYAQYTVGLNPGVQRRRRQQTTLRSTYEERVSLWFRKEEEGGGLLFQMGSVDSGDVAFIQVMHDWPIRGVMCACMNSISLPYPFLIPSPLHTPTPLPFSSPHLPSPSSITAAGIRGGSLPH